MNQYEYEVVPMEIDEQPNAANPQPADEPQSQAYYVSFRFC